MSDDLRVPAPETFKLAGNGSAVEVFLAFLKLGLMSFGGPIAHLGYFRDELVVRRRWIDEAGYADLIALCQFLPGPASRQVGFSLGLLRAGALGGLAAWTAYTLPSATILAGFAYGASYLAGPTGLALIHGLKLVAVAIVAHAVWGMARSLTPDLPRIFIAAASLAVGGTREPRTAHDLPVAPSLLARNFTVDAPNKVWTSHINYIWTIEG